MKLLIKLCLILVSTPLCINSLAANDQTITFKNQRGSTMILTLHPGKNNTGTLTGTFTTAVGCKADVNTPMLLTGFYNGNAMSIAIDFVDCKSVASMSGNFVNNQTELDMLWLVTSISQDPMHKNWNSNLIGSDYFKKVG